MLPTIDAPRLPDGFLSGFLTFYHHPSGWHYWRIAAEPDATTPPDVHAAAVALIAAIMAAGGSPVVEKRSR